MTGGPGRLSVCAVTMYLLLPFIAAISFALGSIIYKRAYAEGAGVVHALVVNNVVLGLLFFPLMWLDPEPVSWKLAHLPLIAAVPFALGHLMNVASLRVGDVSVATPLLGAKVTFVALILWVVFHEPLNASQWIAAGLTTTGVLVMGLTDLRPGRRLGLTTALALGCAAAFAVTDVMIQMWASRIGVWNFLGLLFSTLGVLSLAILPFFGRAALRAPKAAWKWIGFGVSMSGLQAILITGSIGVWKDAAGANVVYSTRGLLSIAFVWFIGHRLKNSERQSAGGRAMFQRTIGGVLILAAVVLTAMGTKR